MQSIKAIFALPHFGYLYFTMNKNKEKKSNWAKSSEILAGKKVSLVD